MQHTVNYEKEKRYSLVDFIDKEWYQTDTNDRRCDCHVIVTCKSMLWTLLTLVATLTVVSAIITPQWMVGPPRARGIPSPNATEQIFINNGKVLDDTYYKTKNRIAEDEDVEKFSSTIGIFNRCTRLQGFTDLYTGSIHCATFVTSFGMSGEEFPDSWKATLILYTIAVGILGFCVCTAVLSLCVRGCFKKSIFTITGLLQAIAGLILIVGTVIYPSGWGTQRVQRVCGDRASPYIIDDCELGWAFYVVLGGIVLVFLCSVLSIQADKGTSTDKVESEILDGKTLICVI